MIYSNRSNVRAYYEKLTNRKLTNNAHYVIMSLDAETIACYRNFIAKPDENLIQNSKLCIIESFSHQRKALIKSLDVRETPDSRFSVDT